MSINQEYLDLDNRLPAYRWQGGRKLRRGFTTGACAAAAARAALTVLLGQVPVSQTIISLPGGIRVALPVETVCFDQGAAICAVVKDAGDDPDVTHGLPVTAEVQWQSGSKVILQGGSGVGRVTRPGLAAIVGEAAINPGPRGMILNEINSLRPAGRGLLVIISVPGGEQAATKTLNPRLGIIGGISILGTSGIVEPMSEEACRTSLTPQIDLALAQGLKTLVLTPGRMGQRTAQEIYGISEPAIIQMSNFVGFMLEECARRGVEKVLLFGHAGKLIKIAAGIFHTHSRVAGGALETMAAYAALVGTPPVVIREIMAGPTVEQAITVLRLAGYQEVLNTLARTASERATAYIYEQMSIGTVFTLLDGSLAGIDAQAVVIGKELGWQIVSG